MHRWIKPAKSFYIQKISTIFFDPGAIRRPGLMMQTIENKLANLIIRGFKTFFGAGEKIHHKRLAGAFLQFYVLISGLQAAFPVENIGLADGQCRKGEETE
jgi:hypothetical protein